MARQRREREAAKDEASQILKRAGEEADTLRESTLLQGKEEVFGLRESWEKEEDRRREEVERLERRHGERSEFLDKKFDSLSDREAGQEARARELDRQDQSLRDRAQNVKELEDKARERLEALAGLSAQDAKAQLMESMVDEARAEASQDLRDIKEEAARTADREAKKILALSIQRMAADQTAETTVSVVQLPSDEMKGRIIGREGRNIRAFEQATGVDVIIDDTPEAVVLSAFNPIRREVARIALEKLIEDGRIHPGRIEEMVSKSEDEVGKGIVEAAEEVLYGLGIHNVHPEIVKVLGAVEVSDFLRPKPAFPFTRSGPPRRKHGCGNGTGFPNGQTGRASPRRGKGAYPRAGRYPRGAGMAFVQEAQGA